jgi:hypothetical protein
MFGMMMKFKATEFDCFFESTNATKPCFLEKIVGIGWVASYEDPTNYADEELRGEEEYFDSAKKAIAWLETKVSFTVDLEEV